MGKKLYRWIVKRLTSQIFVAALTLLIIGNLIDADTSLKIENQILTDERQDPVFLVFTVEDISDLFSYTTLIRS